MNEPRPESSERRAPQTPEERLSSWKEIAAYLGRDVRTVQRWERTQGLPVYRHKHNQLSTAYAVKGELDAWWHQRPPSGTAEAPDLDPRAEQPAAPKVGYQTPHPSRLRWRTLAGLAALASLLAVLAGYSPLRRGADAPRAGFAARDFVLIVPFQNRTGEPLFDGSLEHALERELSDSPFVNVVPPQRLQDTLELMQQLPDTRLDLAMGREVALRDGHIRALVAGRIERYGRRYGLTTDLIQATDGAIVASVREEARDESDVLAAIRRLARGVRGRLGETLPSLPKDASILPRNTTKSLEALQLYAKALDTIGWSEDEPYDPSAASLLIRQALELDPEFAQARMTLASLSADSRDAQMAMLPQVERAVAAARQIPEVERLLIEAQAHLFRSSLFVESDGIAREHARNQGLAALEAVLRLRPDHLTALQSLRQNVRDAGRTRELARREAELRPTSARAHVIAARLAMADLDVPGARRSVERARALRVPLTHLAPSPAVWLALFDAEEAWQMGDPARALAVADQFAARRRDLPQAFQGQATAQLFFLYLSLGRLQQADGMLESMAASVDTVFRDQQRGRLIAMRADRRALATFLGARFRSTEQAQFVGSNLIDAGLLQMARAVISYHKQHRNLLPYDWYAGQLALVEGRHDEAVRRLTSASMLLPASGNQGLKIARQLADAHRGQGHLDKAVTLLEDATRRRSELTHAWEWLRARDRLAELYRDAGRLSDAERVERELMVLLSVADEDHGIKRRLARTDEVRVAR